MLRTPIIPAGSAPLLTPHSPGVWAGIVVDDLIAQPRHVLLATQAVFETKRVSMADTAMNGILVENFADDAVVKATYAEYLPSEPPARTRMFGDLARSGFLVETTSTARLA